MTPVDWIKDEVRSFVLAPEFDMKHLKKAGGHITWNKEEDNSLKTLSDKNLNAAGIFLNVCVCVF